MIIEQIKNEGIPEHTDNGEFKFHFFEKDRTMEPTPACDGSIQNLKDAIRAGVARCIILEDDVDMFVNVEGNTLLPKIKLESIPGITSVRSVNGSLHCTVVRLYELNVIFSGGAHPVSYSEKNAPAAAPAPARRIVKAVKPAVPNIKDETINPRANRSRAAKAKAPTAHPYKQSIIKKDKKGGTGTILDSVPFMSDKEKEEYALEIAEAERKLGKKANKDDDDSTGSEKYMKGMSQMML